MIEPATCECECAHQLQGSNLLRVKRPDGSERWLCPSCVEHSRPTEAEVAEAIRKADVEEFLAGVKAHG